MSPLFVACKPLPAAVPVPRRGTGLRRAPRGPWMPYVPLAPAPGQPGAPAATTGMTSPWSECARYCMGVALLR